MCSDGVNCKRRICFFAHTESELRKLEDDPLWLQQQLQMELGTGELSSSQWGLTPCSAAAVADGAGQGGLFNCSLGPPLLLAQEDGVKAQQSSLSVCLLQAEICAREEALLLSALEILMGLVHLLSGASPAAAEACTHEEVFTLSATGNRIYWVRWSNQTGEKSVFQSF
eukprot:scaffold14281_cov19-Tisochrysis_lutea.AAC.1